MSGPAEWTVTELQVHLMGAVELELTTIPPYLTALYSLEPEKNEAAAKLIRSVVIEEMLHLALASNVLNAIGGHPDVTGEYTPRYPAKLPFHEPESFEVGLAPFSEEALDTFLTIEDPNHPSVAGLRAASSDAATSRVFELAQQYGYKTIGEFYGAVEEGLKILDARGGLFVEKPPYPRQITSDAYRGGPGQGHIVIVQELKTALEALEEIVEQGEGDVTKPAPGDKFDPEGELAHYYRFQELQLGREYLKEDMPGHPTGAKIEIESGAVYPMRPNLKAAELSGELLKEAEEFNDLYSGLVREIQTGIDGQPKALDAAIGKMFTLPNAIQGLMRTPLPDGSGTHAGPTFEYR
jgi:hypothetical protein